MFVYRVVVLYGDFNLFIVNLFVDIYRVMKNFLTAINVSNKRNNSPIDVVGELFFCLIVKYFKIDIFYQISPFFYLFFEN